MGNGAARRAVLLKTRELDTAPGPADDSADDEWLNAKPEYGITPRWWVAVRTIRNNRNKYWTAAEGRLE